ncbi:NAD(P)-dependent oxidoreductase, partial [candidate division KSB1 bacterium]|nr:NAD(P)-dependent oxidoreductase [candidate division KSB1 bacterium]NIR68966.1 NAD(P)-dependent oxidoreductase [candidate division KSB1 bacterium]NIS26752.1 NAD(P)-dependent oxidoreductase [candidate division KSB1 bacterium]NIT73500.1 NAD(P)-dependent oxidoreductase [candidate division KSB1 bacterium]NIU24691.1 NAD(P)-dependent oxidoreductase [candidate division KSB1 bacterium]
MRLALIGTGLMGYPMAERILENDYPLTVYNRSRHKAEPLAKVGAKIANSPAEAIGNAECVILMLSDAEAIRDVLFNSEPRPDINTRTVIQMSTIA